MNNGSLVVASIVVSPVQKDTREENEKIKYGEKPEGWKGNKTSQKDLDADWTKRSMDSIGMAIKILSKLIRKVS